MKHYTSLMLAIFFLQACGPAGQNKPEKKKDDSFDTAHVAVQYIPADHQDSLIKACQVEYRWFVHEKNEDSTVEYYNEAGKLTSRLTYNEFGKLKEERLFEYDVVGVLVEVKEKTNGKLTGKRIYERQDTLKTAEFYLDMETRDTVLKLKYIYDQNKQLAKLRDLSSPNEWYVSKYTYWPNGLLRKEELYYNDSLTGTLHYRHNHKGHLREMQGNNSGSYIYEKRLYNDKGELREKNASVSFMGVNADQSYVYNYNEKRLLKRVGTVKNTEAPPQSGQLEKQWTRDSEITYIKYKYRNEP